ncbi:hypothetical protein [Acrocarpospora sp. B8E8]|uniref:hypothetical protein n=1 Tax=Acrocarpospora sp. B8E8 TaxID=3153572 RepID=UPI00325E3D43
MLAARNSRWLVATELVFTFRVISPGWTGPMSWCQRATSSRASLAASAAESSAAFAERSAATAD